ncbi:MAG: hypothetical protein IJ025_02765 [Clostridia bacterium]|nr:hypothetical protein [Clostridia bacterium]
MMKEKHFSDEILNVLNSFFADGRSPHAVLIDGGSQDERQSLAKLTAKMIVCANQDMTPCGMCENCRKADEDIHPDIITVTKPDDKKFFVKSDVKKVVADAYLTPNDSLKKVYVLSEIQQMNEESQNLLLKILEEPPVYTAFVLTSQNANSVIGTVLSRVVRVRLGNSSAIEYSQKAINIVAELSAAVLSPYEFDKIQATAPLDGNKKLTAEVLELFISVLRDAIALKSGGKILCDDFKAHSTELSEKLTVKKLLDMYDAVCLLYRSLDNNPNYTLLSAVLCARI